jgi:tRNA(Arg) A34 adenosine deaminase TadA
MNEEFMREATRLAMENIDNGGGPFAAVIVKNGKIIARGANRVTANCDPTAHAEVMAIREASKNLGTFDLAGTEIYTTCEPCPMCLGAIYWAHIKTIYYGNTQADAEAIDFSDKFIYEEFAKPVKSRMIPQLPLLREETIKSFEKWASKTDKTPY